MTTVKSRTILIGSKFGNILIQSTTFAIFMASVLLSLFGTKKIVENFETNNGGKVGTVVGGVGAGTVGLGIGGVIGTTTTLTATIGTTLFPGVGTVVGGLCGAAIGFIALGLTGSIIGGEIGKKVDPTLVKQKDTQSMSKNLDTLISSDNPESVVKSIQWIIKDLFNQHTRGNSLMSPVELRKFLYDLGVFVETDDELDCIMRNINTAQEGHLTFEEFYHWYQNNDRFVKMEETVVLYREAATLFKKYDLDGNGRLDIDEFKDFYEELTHTHLTTKVSVQEAMSKLDLNGDGFIEFNEFIAWLKWF